MKGRLGITRHMEHFILLMLGCILCVSPEPSQVLEVEQDLTVNLDPGSSNRNGLILFAAHMFCCGYFCFWY